MAFASVFDETGAIETIVFPKTFDITKDIWSANTAILFKGKVDSKDDELTVIIENAVDLDKYTKQ